MNDVPYVAHEAMLARLERTIKRLWVLCIILIALLFCTNAGWIYYEAQFETVESSIEQEVDADGNSTVYNAGGDLDVGTHQAENKD